MPAQRPESSPQPQQPESAQQPESSQQPEFSQQDAQSAQQDTLNSDISARASSHADTDSQKHDNQVSSSKSDAGSHSTAAEQADGSLSLRTLSGELATKKSAVNADYSMSNAKAAKKKIKPAASAAKATAAAAGAAPRQSAAAAPAADVKAIAVAGASSGDLQRPAPVRNVSSSSLDTVKPLVFMPPKPKPGGSRARPAQPVIERASVAVGQPHYVTPLPTDAMAQVPRRPSSSLPAALHQSQADAASAWQHARAQAQEQQLPSTASRQRQQQNMVTAKPQRQPSEDRLPVPQKLTLENRAAAAPQASDSSAQQSQQSDEGWETVGHKAPLKQQQAHPTRQPSPPPRAPVKEPPRLAQTESIPQDRAAEQSEEMPQPELPDTPQGQSGADHTAAPSVTLAPNSAWARRLPHRPGAGSSPAAASASLPSEPSSKPEAGAFGSDLKPQSKLSQADAKPQAGGTKPSPSAKSPVSQPQADKEPSVPAPTSEGNNPASNLRASEAKPAAAPSAPPAKAEGGPSVPPAKPRAKIPAPQVKPDVVLPLPTLTPEAGSSEAEPLQTAPRSEGGPELEAGPSESAAQAEAGPSEVSAAPQAAAQKAEQESGAPKKKKNRGRKKRGAGPMQQQAPAEPIQPASGRHCCILGSQTEVSAVLCLCASLYITLKCSHLKSGDAGSF